MPHLTKSHQASVVQIGVLPFEDSLGLQAFIVLIPKNNLDSKRPRLSRAHDLPESQW